MKSGAIDPLPAFPKRPARSPLSERAKWAIFLAAVLAVWALVDVRVRGTVDPNDRGVHRTDLTVYTEAGAAFFDGRPPYDVTNPRGWRYLYPPLFAMLLAPLHVLPPQAQVLVWFVLSALVAWGCYRECVRLANAVLPAAPEGDPFGAIPAWIGWIACAGAMLPVLNCLQRGQVSVLKLYLILLGVRLVVENRSPWRALLGGVVMALSIVLKITPLVPVGLVVFQQFVSAWHATEPRAAWRRAGGLSLGTLAGLVLGLLLVPSVLVGWGTNWNHLQTWWTKIAVQAETSAQDDLAGDNYSAKNQSFANAARRFGNWSNYMLGGAYDRGIPGVQGGRGMAMDRPLVDRLLLVARLIAGGLLLAVCYRTAAANDALGEIASISLACAATLVLFTIARATYFVMILPAAIFVSIWLAQRGRRRWAAFACIAPAILIGAHYLLFSIAGRVGLLGLGTAGWFVAASVMMLRLGPAVAGKIEIADDVPAPIAQPTRLAA